MAWEYISLYSYSAGLGLTLGRESIAAVTGLTTFELLVCNYANNSIIIQVHNHMMSSWKKKKKLRWACFISNKLFCVSDRCGNFEHGYKTFMEQIFGDNILFADGQYNELKTRQWKFVFFNYSIVLCMILLCTCRFCICIFACLEAKFISVACWSTLAVVYAWIQKKKASKQFVLNFVKVFTNFQKIQMLARLIMGLKFQMTKHTCSGML